jgi:hypothetical protein
MVFELGPVLRHETRQVARRKVSYVQRVAFCLALLALLGIYQEAFNTNLRNGGTPAQARVLLGRFMAESLAAIHLFIALIIAPLAGADAFQRERLRRAAPTLLMTPLTPTRIVLETLAARLVPGLTLWLCLAPITLFIVLWCGLNPELAFVLEIVTLGTILVGITLSLALSLWTGRAYVALLGTYGLLGAWTWSWAYASSLPRLAAWLPRSNPYLILFNRLRGFGPGGFDDAWFFVVFSGGVAIALTGAMAHTFRRFALAPPRRRAQWKAAGRRALFGWTDRLPGPTLDGNPILWREWWCARASIWGKVVVWLFFVVAFALTIITARFLWQGQIGGPDLIAVVGYEIGVGLLAVAVRAASSWSAERAAGQGAVDVLLSTPLSAATFVQGKWWAAYRGVLPLAVLAAIGTAILAAGAPVVPVVPGWYAPPSPPIPLTTIDRIGAACVVIGHVLLYGAVYVSLGIFLATRFDRPARAVKFAVTVFVILALVLPTVAEALFNDTNRLWANRLGLGSPLGGPIATLSSMYSASFMSPRELLPANVVWLGTAGIFAWMFARWTINHFDRWMGRMPSSDGELADQRRRTGSSEPPAAAMALEAGVGAGASRS